jgi:FkbM family methyltransferase
MTAGGRMAEFFLRYATPFSGVRRWPVVGPALSWLSEKLVPRGVMAWVQVRRGPAAGIWLLLNPRTGRMMLEGGGEPEVQAALVEHLAEGMTVFDVGANIGFFSLLAARLVGPTGCVVAFEADPEIAARLRENAARNEYSWIVVEQQAVREARGESLFLRGDPAVSPDRGLGRVVAEEMPGTIRVAGISLDDYAGREAYPDFVKCDVEGAEVEVFRGAEHLLRDKRPKILCEIHSEVNNRLLKAQLADLGYQCLMLDVNHLLALPRQEWNLHSRACGN